MSKRVVVRRKKATFPKPNLPAKPKVTVGSRCYGRTKHGGYIVCRFFITQWQVGKAIGKQRTKPSDPWFVVDLEEGSVASGTKKSGYPKDKAIQVARRYRDEFGAWSVMPF